MKLSEFKTVILDALAANPALAAFGSTIEYTLAGNTADEIKDTVSARMEQVGVCIELGLISSAMTGEKSATLRKRNVSFEIYVLESAHKAHSPSGLSLVDEVIDTLEGIQNRVYRPDCTTQAAAINDAGHILHILSFDAQIYTR